MQLSPLDYTIWLTAPDDFARQLAASIRRDGFMLLDRHPVVRTVRERAFAAARGFFALPEEEKNRININRSPNHRGYFAPGQEKLDIAAYPQGDSKEGLKIGRDLDSSHPLVRAGIPLHGPNQWPKDAGFKPAMQALFDVCLETSRQLMDALGLALGLPRGYFTPMLTQPMATLAPLRYSPPGEGEIGAGAHTDFGCLTLVMQDGVPGLQFFDARDGAWVDAPSDPDLLVVNVGDMLERWSNHRFPSTRHRVANKSERYSFAFFFDPNYNASIAPLPSADGANPPLYEPIGALEYLQQRIGESFDYFDQHGGETNGKMGATA